MDRTGRSTLLDEVKSYRPSALKSVETRVTRIGGTHELEKKSSSGSFLSNLTGSGRQWFALDYRPDLQVGLILPGLLLGAQDVAQDLSRLRKLGVTHILNVATGVPNCFQGEITYKRLDIRDHPDSNIRKHFDECFRFIDEGRRTGWVLVHCNAGISRAASICIGYLMSREHKRYEDAYKKVKEARPIICPNYGFVKQLRAYDEELNAKLLP